VAITTYNHETTSPRLDSVLEQNLEARIEVVVADDCSTDGTFAILASYEARYPNRIRLLSTSQNLGMMKNFARVLDACTGEYVALLDGDDYWTSPDKLRTQVDFLDANPGAPSPFTTVSSCSTMTAVAPVSVLRSQSTGCLNS